MSDNPVIHVCGSTYSNWVDLDEHKLAMDALIKAAQRHLRSTASPGGRPSTTPEAKALREAIAHAKETLDK